MKVRFQADADLNQVIVRAVLRLEPTIDFQTAHVGRLAGLNDQKVLSAAAIVGRLLVTHDRKTIPRHFGQFIMTRQSPGVLVIPQRLAVHRAAEDLFLSGLQASLRDWTNRIYTLPI